MSDKSHMQIRQSDPYSRKAHRGPRHDPLGPISFGAFLIAIAIIALSNPSLPTQFFDYLKSFGEIGQPITPPSHLLRPIADFCLYFGVWLIVLAALRISFRLGTWNVPGDMSGGVFLIVLSYIILDTIKTQGDVTTLLAYLMIGLGVAVLADGIGRFMMRE
ncbi:MAG: hypothetical protein ACUVQ8_02575 [Nitrososphaeria archaeon]